MFQGSPRSGLCAAKIPLKHGIVESRHLIAYGLILGILLLPVFVLYRMKRAARRERHDAERPIRITRDRKKRD